MRSAFLAQFASIALMALALRLLQVDGEHIYSPKDASYYQFMAGSGLFLLFLAFLVFTIASAYLSKTLSSLNAMVFGCLILVAARVTWEIVISKAAMDNWTTMLIVPPLIGGLSGFILIVVGAIRMLLKKISLLSQ